MQRIVINEQDLTTAGFAAGNVNIAYVPGFAKINEDYKYVIGLDSTVELVAHGEVPKTPNDVAAGDLYYEIASGRCWKWVVTATATDTATEEEATAHTIEVATDKTPTTVSSVSIGKNVYEVVESNPKNGVSCTAVIGSSGSGKDIKHHITLTFADADANFIAGASISVAYTYTGEWVVCDPAERDMFIPENTPVLCSNLNEFETYFGKEPVVFDGAVSYDNITGVNSGFAVNAKAAIPFVDAGDFDKSYMYAKELLNMGIAILYDAFVHRDDSNYGERKTGAQARINYLYSNLSSHLELLKDKGEYDVKFITSGAYPTFEFNKNSIVTTALSIAAERGDCLVLIDHTDKPERKLAETSDKSVYYAIANDNSEYVVKTNAQYGTMITPWAAYTLPIGVRLIDKDGITKTYNQAILPGSFAYLACIGQSIQYNPDWYAAAGVTRGLVPYIVKLDTIELMSNVIADSYQNRDTININAITNIKPYGLSIWGNRTLFNNATKGNLTASSFLNIRNLVCNVKKVVYTAAKKCIFEQNTDVLWANFKAMITPTLDQMVTGSGIKGYKIIKKATTEKAKLVAVIKLIPIYALEQIEVTIQLVDDEISVEG